MNKLHSSMMRSRVEQAVRGSFCNPNWVTLILLSSLEKLPGQGTRLPVQPFPSLPGLFPAPCRIHRGLQRISSICSLAVVSCRLFPQSAPVSLFRLFVGIKRREGDRWVSSFWERGSCTQLWFFCPVEAEEEEEEEEEEEKARNWNQAWSFVGAYIVVCSFCRGFFFVGSDLSLLFFSFLFSLYSCSTVKKLLFHFFARNFFTWLWLLLEGGGTASLWSSSMQWRKNLAVIFLLD